jgi:hypothetical protein
MEDQPTGHGAANACGSSERNRQRPLLRPIFRRFRRVSREQYLERYGDSWLRIRQAICCRDLREGGPALPPNGDRSRRPRPRPHLWLGHDRIRCRAVGPTLDHDRHLPCGAGARPRPHHGRALPVLPAEGLAGGAAEGSRDHAHGAVVAADARQRASWIRLRARAAHHAEVDRQQCGDRRDLGAVAGDARTAARAAERGRR